MPDRKTAPQPTEEPARFGVRHALVLMALLLTVALNPIVGLLSGNAQAEIAIHFRTTELAWFTLIGALVGTFMLPFVVKAAGMYGKKRVIVIVTTFGLVGDLIAASATSFDMLLVGRGIAGVYGTAAAVAYAAARDVFPRPLVGPASALLAGSVGIVGLGGPFLSGWLIDTWGFRGALWFMVAATALSLVILLAFLPESPVREARVRMDWLGAILLGGGLTAIAYGVGEGSEWGWTSGEFLAFLAGGLLALAAFGFVQTRVANPLFPMSLLARRQVWTVLLATGVSAGALYSVGIVMQLLALMPKIPTVSDGLGWSATHNALVTAPVSVVVIVAAVGTGILARRVDPRLLLGAGGILTTIGYGIGAEFHYTAGQIVSWGLISGIGMGMVISSVPILIISAVSPQEQALGNGAQNMVQGTAQVVISQLVFVVMAKDGKVMHGTQFYSDSGFSTGFWLVAGCCAAGTLLVLLIPKAKKLDEVEAGQAAA
ncbi:MULTISPECIES: MFS transporter [unclassified Streptomyces]|uniref:MFS transporter n=1 Tax=unclassified Streptomyces TaxID=2593676 RepID=UPI002E7A9476|nr:MFS transporter [Streptomyces sp. JV176]MEE1800686.1 MFS transporter [Streptomyces sp. JV176]